MAEQTWEQRIREAATWLRERHAAAGVIGASGTWLVDHGDGRCTCGAAGYYSGHEPGCGMEPLADLADVGLAQLVAALVAMAPALADLLEGEADKQALWIQIRAEVMPEFVIDPETARSASPSWIRQIVEAVERVRGGVTA